MESRAWGVWSPVACVGMRSSRSLMKVGSARADPSCSTHGVEGARSIILRQYRIDGGSFVGLFRIYDVHSPGRLHPLPQALRTFTLSRRGSLHDLREVSPC
jgi:hypothetical protein